MKHLKEFELNEDIINESDSQTWRKLQFIKDQIRNITKTIREIDWNRATDNEKSELVLSLEGLTSLVNKKSK